MALFKILRGDSTRISTDVTPFHDGYAYFTPDDGGFYIDSEKDGVQTRHRINPEFSSDAVSATLSASGWSGKQQQVSVQGLLAEQNGVISLAQNVTDEQYTAAMNANLRVSGQGAGYLTITAVGTVPTVDIPVSVLTLQEEVRT